MEAQQIGNQKFRKGCFVEAENYYTKGLEIDPQSHILLCNRSNARMMQGKLEEALGDVSASLQIQSSNWKAWYIKGFCEYELGTYNEAMQSYVRALELQPGDYKICMHLLAVVNRVILVPNLRYCVQLYEMKRKGVNIDEYIASVSVALRRANAPSQFSNCLEIFKAYLYIRNESLIVLAPIFFDITDCFDVLERKQEALICGHIRIGLCKKYPDRFDNEATCRALRLVGLTYHNLSSRENSIRFLRISKYYSGLTNNLLLQACTCDAFATALINSSALFEANEVLEQGLSVLNQIPTNSESRDSINITRLYLLQSLGKVHQECGNAKMAAKFFEEVFGISKMINDARFPSHIFFNLYTCYMYLHRFEDALRCIDEAEKNWNMEAMRLNFMYFKAVLYQQWAWQSNDADLKQQRFGNAAKLFEQLVDAAENTNDFVDPNLVCYVYMQYFAFECINENRFADAANFITQSIDVAEKHNLMHVLGVDYVELALIFIKLNNIHKAIDYALRAENLLDSMKDQWKLDQYLAFAGNSSWLCYTALEIAYSGLGDIKAAVEIAERRRSQALVRRFEMHHQSTKISFDDLQHYARDNNSVLIYYSVNAVSDESSEIIAYIVPPTGDPIRTAVNTVEQDVITQLLRNSQFSNSTGSLRKLKIKMKPGTSKPDYEVLYGVCWRSIEKYIKELQTDVQLVILSQEYLNHIPFCALQNAEKKRLIEQHSISIAPCISVLTKLGLSAQICHAKVIAVGNPKMPQFRAFPALAQLPMAEKEVGYVAELFKVLYLLFDRNT